jgi:Rod binding domain-containing protein
VIDPIDTSVLPPDVRASGAKDQQLYAAALAFEQALTQQLTQSLADSAMPQDDGSGDDSGDGSSDVTSSTDATASVYRQMLPDALSQGVTGAGGLGLAHDLWLQLRSQAGES